MHSKCVLVDRHAEGKRLRFFVYMKDAAGQSQCIKIMKSVYQCTTLVAGSLMLVTVICFLHHSASKSRHS